MPRGIIEVKVQLRDDAVAAAWAIDRDQRLDVELEGVADTLPDVKRSPPTFAGWPPPARSGD
jgi:hypothetical protein